MSIEEGLEAMSALFFSVSSADGVSLPHLTTGSALSFKSYEALWVPG